MIFIIVCIICFILLVILLIKDNVEQYKLLNKIADIIEPDKQPTISVTKASTLGVSLKYGPNSDYSTFHQKRARGQIRTTGEDS